MLVVFLKLWTDLADLADKSFIQYGHARILYSIDKERRRLVKIDTASVTDKRSFGSKLYDVLFAKVVNAVKPKQSFLDIKEMFADFALAQYKLSFAVFPEP